MRSGAVWTSMGDYNWVAYEDGERIEALPGSPKAHTEYVVYWFPGKPTLGCVLADATPETAGTWRLARLPRRALIVCQEPIPNGAWWVREGNKTAGPYSWDDVMRMLGTYTSEAEPPTGSEIKQLAQTIQSQVGGLWGQVAGVLRQAERAGIYYADDRDLVTLKQVERLLKVILHQCWTITMRY